MERPSRKFSPDDVLKLAIVLAGCVSLRFLPRPPNVEPVMTGLLPFGKRYGWMVGALFGGFGILLFDAAVGQVGPWSWFTAGTYVLVGAAAGWWLGRFSHVTRWHYAGFAFAATVFYDAVTAYSFGSMLGYPLPVIVAGQIPFTLLHLASNVFGAAVLSPLIEKFVLENRSLTLSGMGAALRDSLSLIRI